MSKTNHSGRHTLVGTGIAAAVALAIAATGGFGADGSVAPTVNATPTATASATAPNHHSESSPHSQPDITNNGPEVIAAKSDVTDGAALAGMGLCKAGHCPWDKLPVPAPAPTYSPTAPTASITPEEPMTIAAASEPTDSPVSDAPVPDYTVTLESTEATAEPDTEEEGRELSYEDAYAAAVRGDLTPADIPVYGANAWEYRGIVEHDTNDRYHDGYHNPVYIENNYGTVSWNGKTVIENNYGEVHMNGGADTGGIIINNYGTVHNNSNGTIDGVIVNNYGTVEGSAGIIHNEGVANE